MNCEDAKQHLVEMLYGELDEQQRRGLEAHLDACESCRGEHELLRQSHHVLGRFAPEPPTHKVEVAAVYRRAQRGLARSRARWRLAAAVVGVAAVVAAVLSVSAVRLELHASRLVLAWGPADPPQQPPVPAFDARLELEQFEQRLAKAEQLMHLTAHEVLDADRRQAAQLSILKHEFAAWKRRTARVLSELEQSDDVRWRLIMAELQSGRHGRVMPAIEKVNN